jgi:GH25 family lysozyme M1 (1,4-beta-N-acetylmuramidase)
MLVKIIVWIDYLNLFGKAIIIYYFLTFSSYQIMKYISFYEIIIIPI